MINFLIFILFGDGIGLEVMGEVKKIIGWFGDKCGLVFDVSEDFVGGVVYDVYGVLLYDDIMVKV